MTTLEEIQDRADKATEGPWETIQADEEETTTWLESPYGDVLNHDTRGSGHLREDFTWMKRSDAEFIAHAREDVPRLLAALDAVLALHVPVAVYSYNDVDGVFDLDEDGELIKLYEVCGTCTPGDTLEALGDCEFTDDDPYTIYPCPTLNAITEALEAS